MTKDVDFFFDGQCGFCTKAVGWIKWLDRRDRVSIPPFQRPGVRERFHLEETEVRTSAWSCRSDRRASGAESVNLALDAALGTGIFSAFYRVPGAHWVQDRIYAWVAAHRYLLPGVMP